MTATFIAAPITVSIGSGGGTETLGCEDDIPCVIRYGPCDPNVSQCLGASVGDAADMASASSAKKRVVLLVAGHVRVKGHHHVTVKLKLTAAGRKLLAKHKWIKVVERIVIKQGKHKSVMLVRIKIVRHKR